MEIWQLVIIIVGVCAATAAFIWNALHLSKHRQAIADQPHHGDKKHSTGADAQMYQDINQDVEHIFDEKFRAELRNRGRLHFEKIIGENAMFLQQDLRLTTSQLNDFMKQEMVKTLQSEFAKYEQSINDAKQLAIDSIEKTRAAIEQQRQILGEQLEHEVQAEKQRQIARFEKNMAEIINHYVVAAIGNQIDLEDQLEYILGDLESNKQAILEDIKSGA